VQEGEIQVIPKSIPTTRSGRERPLMAFMPFIAFMLFIPFMIAIASWANIAKYEKSVRGLEHDEKTRSTKFQLA
jgi:ABC-type Na+ efflux pump permease subunit